MEEVALPSLPPTIYVPIALALVAAISGLCGAVVYCVKWARSEGKRADAMAKEKDGIEHKWITLLEQEIPNKLRQMALTERLLKAVGEV